MGDVRRVMRAQHASRVAATAMRTVGRALVVAGLVVGGFVVHQLFVTDLMADRAQVGLAAEFQERADAVVAVAAPLGTGQALPRSPFADRPDPAPAGPVTPPAGSVETPAPPVILTEPVPDRGEPVGRLVVESAGIDWTVVEGVGRSQLRTGTGHIPGNNRSPAAGRHKARPRTAHRRSPGDEYDRNGGGLPGGFFP